jgi:putative methylase
MGEPLVNSKARLAVELSKLKVFDKPDVRAEQYPTDSEAAADALWNAYFAGDIQDKTIADLGCGTGILGIGALLLGAKKVFFIDSDHNVLETAKTNLHEFVDMGEAVFLHEDVKEFNEKVNTVIQNPPFGTRKEHADREFLMKAFQIADVIYSYHKSTTENFITKISEDNGFKITHRYDYNFPLKATLLFHKKKIQRIKVSCWRMERVQRQLDKQEVPKTEDTEPFKTEDTEPVGPESEEDSPSEDQ